MEKTKKTQKEMYEMIKGVCADNVEIVDFCNLKIEQLAKKNANSTTKVQKENIEVVDMLIQELEKIGEKSFEDYKKNIVWGYEKTKNP